MIIIVNILEKTQYLSRYSSSILIHTFRDWSMKKVFVQTQGFRIWKIILGTVVLIVTYPSSLLILLWFIIVCLIKHPVYIMYLYCLQCCNLYQTIIMHEPARPTFVWCWLVKVKEFANGHISLSSNIVRKLTKLFRNPLLFLFLSARERHPHASSDRLISQGERIWKWTHFAFLTAASNMERNFKNVVKNPLPVYFSLNWAVKLFLFLSGRASALGF